MSTETTNKKIKIDNGTTFGRTYTDKAVDELLKGVGGQKVYTCAITDLLSISDIQNLIGVITSSRSSTAKKYNLLKSIDDIINEYDYIYVDTSALQMAGGLTFRKQINAGNNKNFALCYGYFNFDISSNKISSFANIAISLSDAWYVETISNLTLLPNVDGTSANNGKVLTFDTNSLGTNGVPYKWAEVGSGGTSVIELTDKNGTIASAQLSEINANPQNFSFKYNGKILLFTKADSTTYQYCNNTTSSSEHNVMATSTLLTIKSSTGSYTIAEDVHNVVANSIHPANGGDLTSIQVGSKVYSIPSGGGGGGKVVYHDEALHFGLSSNTTYEKGSIIKGPWNTLGEKDIGYLPGYEIKTNNGLILYPIWMCIDSAQKKMRMDMYVAVGGTNDTFKDITVRCIRVSIE